MNNIRLINFRNIEDSTPIELKPLTFFVGKNGAGKSSFLRLFPLLKQSLSEPKRGPLLWYTETGVDFGDFKTTVMKGESTMGIGFDVVVSNRRKQTTLSVLMNIEAEKEDDQYDYVSFLNLKYDDVSIQIDFHEDKAMVVVNGEDMGEHSFYKQAYNLFPVVFSKRREDDEKLLDEIWEVIRSNNNNHLYKSSYEFMYMSFEDFSKLFEGKDIRYNLKTLFGRLVSMNLDELITELFMNLNY